MEISPSDGGGLPEMDDFERKEKSVGCKGKILQYLERNGEMSKLLKNFIKYFCLLFRFRTF